jgi:hypothetical protein
MNYVFISPHFPSNYRNFAIALRAEGVKVLGIGSESYDSLDESLKGSLTEYYRVDDMESYDQMFKACAYLSFKHGKIDWLESHNEHWLEQDAKLRSDFNIPGYKNLDMPKIKKKSKMKQIFRNAGVPVARGAVVNTIDEALKLIKKVGYPVCAKPDNGVGAANTYKIQSQEELESFFSSKPNIEYIMEEFIEGEIHTYDGLVDTDGNIIFQNSFIFGKGIMETVNDHLDQFYYSQREIPDDLLEYGMAAVGAFRMKGRFFHIEFFRKTDGELVALEINVRPPGGLSLDMFNYANDIDVYKKYALMVLGKDAGGLSKSPYFCGFVGIKDIFGSKQMHNNDEITARYSNLIVTYGPIASVFAGALGNYSYVLKSSEFEPLREASEYILQRESL